MSFRKSLSAVLGIIRPSDSASLQCLHDHTDLVMQAGQALKNLIEEENPEKRNALHERIVTLEKNADTAEKNGITEIHMAIILPFDRSLLLRALELSDDVIDGIRKTSFEITKSQIRISEQMRQAAEAIRLETQAMAVLPELLRSPERNSDKIWKTIAQIHAHEKSADQAHRSMIENIGSMSSTNPIEIIMTLRIGDRLEAIADACEDFSQECGRILSDNS